MSIDRFNELNKYIERRNKERNKEAVPLRESNKRMIEARKEKEERKKC